MEPRRPSAGPTHAPLTPTGVDEVHRVADRLRTLPIDGVFSSPLGRAMASAQVYADALRSTVVTVDELREVHHGAMAGLCAEEIEASFPGEMSRRDADKYRWRFPGGESYADGDARARRALGVIARSGAARPLLVSHEMIGRMLLRNLLDLRPPEALTYGHPHEVIYRVDLAEKTLDQIRV